MVSCVKYMIRLHGQAVKTSPFHGGNPGSIPGGVIRRHSQVVRQRSATPLSPVQIWLAPFKKPELLKCLRFKEVILD